MNKYYTENVVIVLNLGNYKTEYQEKVPFKAIVFQDYSDGSIWVRSLETNREYEIYYDQVLECLDIDIIETMIDIGKY